MKYPKSTILNGEPIVNPRNEKQVKVEITKTSTLRCISSHIAQDLILVLTCLYTKILSLSAYHNIISSMVVV